MNTFFKDIVPGKIRLHVDDDIFLDSGQDITPYNYIVNACNTKGVAGSGISKDIKERFPEIFKEYKRFCKDGSIRIGSLAVSYFPSYQEFSENQIILDGIIHFPTKDDWKHPAEVDYLIKGFSYFRKNIPKEWGVAFPLLGAGAGKLDAKLAVDIMISSIIQSNMKNLCGIYCTEEQFVNSGL